jgi:ankyrin repeat protein
MINYNELDEAKKLIEKQQVHITALEIQLENPLIYAVLADKFDLEAKASPKLNPSGGTAIEVAVRFGATEVVKILKDAGAKRDRAISLAVYFDRQDILIELLQGFKKLSDEVYENLIDVANNKSLNIKKKELNQIINILDKHQSDDK